MSNLAISYAAIILADADVEVTADKLLTLTKAANFEEIEPIYAQLYAAALNKADKKELLTAFGATGGAGAGAAPSAAGAAGADAEAPAEEKKQEAEEESDDMDMGMLF